MLQAGLTMTKATSRMKSAVTKWEHYLWENMAKFKAKKRNEILQLRYRNTSCETLGFIVGLVAPFSNLFPNKSQTTLCLKPTCKSLGNTIWFYVSCGICHIKGEVRRVKNLLFQPPTTFRRTGVTGCTADFWTFKPQYSHSFATHHLWPRAALVGAYSSACLRISVNRTWHRSGTTGDSSEHHVLQRLWYSWLSSLVRSWFSTLTTQVLGA